MMQPLATLSFILSFWDCEACLLFARALRVAWSFNEALRITWSRNGAFKGLLLKTSLGKIPEGL